MGSKNSKPQLQSAVETSNSLPFTKEEEKRGKCPVSGKNSNDNATENSTSACPVMRRKKPAEKKKGDIETLNNTNNNSACPVMTKDSGNSTKQQQQQQYNVYSQPIDPTNNMPAIANQLPAAIQKESLSTKRVKSTIPKGGSDSDTWTYPSPQMFYNSLVRKNKLDDTKESDIPTVVALHNNMNEKTWAKVLEWEALLSDQNNNNNAKNNGIKLSRFMGRPSDLSPKARFKNLFFSHPLPFDRHDWTILRPDGTEGRYIIDYYHDESLISHEEATSEEEFLPDMHDRKAVKSILVDVRPALDSPQSFIHRCLKMPMARINNESTFEPLPMIPTKDMKAQLDESLQVWDNIQRSVAGNTSKDQTQAASKNKKSESLSSLQKAEASKISEKEATLIANNFAKMLKDCTEQQQKLNQCKDEEEYAKASLDLSLCMGKIMCPLLHKTMIESLHSEEEKTYDARVEKSLENLMVCIENENARVISARESNPEVFN